MTAPTLSQPANLTFLNKGRVWIMGVLNATPDSFYAASRTPGAAPALELAVRMLEEGADVLDVGGESSRPGSRPIALQVELDRVVPIVEALRQRWPSLSISIDTQKAEVARQAVARGASVVNDISALRADPEMASVAADAKCGVVLMHMQGTPETMQNSPHYDSLLDEVKAFFEERMSAAARAGIAEDKIILDPGIGFGKTLEHNVMLLKNLSVFKSLGRPILVGVSRKSFVAKLLDPVRMPPPEERLDGTLEATLWAIQEGADGVRVHDVGATRRVVG